ncbi:jg1154, partial [Pararge aegeria aegeria]
WILERPLTSMPKVHVNNSIVVVGASRTGLAFLETLLLGPTSEYLTFTNITLVSRHGLPAVTDCMRAAEICIPRDGRYTERYIKSVPFYYYVDIMSAVVIHIDRKKKCIHLKGGGIKFYDELFITCGQQFQHPDYLKDSMELAKEVESFSLVLLMYMGGGVHLTSGDPFARLFAIKKTVPVQRGLSVL